MEIPPKTHEIWKDLILRDTAYTFESLALKLLLKRLKVKILLDPAPEKIDQAINELHTMLSENTKLPKVQRDLETIFGNEGKRS